MRELMGLPIGDITFEDVQAFCAHQTSENIRLDYKREFSSNEPAKKIAKEVAAFANTQGGMLIYGVAEESDRKPEKNPQGADLGSDAKSMVQSACVHNVFPPIVPEVSAFIPNPVDPNKGFLVVRVGASEEIHTVDGGAGIYIRANDQSEPIRASIDRIRWMIQRNERSIAPQADRRVRSQRTLRSTFGTKCQPGDIEISIGPRLVIAPLVDLASLPALARNCSVKSYYLNGATTPIDSQRSPRAMADAIFSDPGYDGTFAEAGCFDVFGNIALVTRLLAECNVADSPSFCKNELETLPKRRDKTVGVDAVNVVERLLGVVRAASNFYSAVGFVGLCELGFDAPEVSGYPLVWTGDRQVAARLGVCALGNEVSVRATYSTVELASDLLVVLDSFVSRILWSWGCTEPNARRVLDRAEQYHYGSRRCSCNGHMHSLIRDRCLRCRSN